MKEIIIPRECPFCGGKLSQIRTDEIKYWQHCYSCHFEFPLKNIIKIEMKEE